MVNIVRQLVFCVLTVSCFAAVKTSTGNHTKDATLSATYQYASYEQDSNVTSSEYENGDYSGSYTDDEDDEYSIEYTPVDYDPSYEQDKLDKKIDKRVGKGKEWFSCDSNRVTFTKDKVCDGFRDCFDCSDEWNCTSTSRNFFYCFGKDHTKSSIPNFFSQLNPMCIPRHKFCDGERDCLNGADEVQSGVGFKCSIKDQFRTCLLPEHMVCDDYVDCEDRSDFCPNTVNVTSSTHFIELTRTDQHPTMFRCLNAGATVFYHQVCDGVIDCPDMSDECLCRHPASPEINKACASVCWNRIWSEGSREVPASCEACGIGETLSPQRIYQNTFPDKQMTRNVTCTKPTEICTSGTYDHRNVCQPHREKSDEFVKCLSVDGSFRTINARMCDARPECFFGEDECVPACNRTRNLFCQLLVPDFGYRCSNQSEDLLIIQPCDGEPQCFNGTDEMFCPNRHPCLVDDGETVTSFHTHTFDILEMCDGHADCLNEADEHPSKCSVTRDTPCDVTKGGECRKKSNDCPVFIDFYNSSDEGFKWQLHVEREASSAVILQYGMLILAACGVVGNLYGLLLGLVNSIYLLKRERYKLTTFLRESVMFTSIATAKVTLGACFAYTLLRAGKQNTHGCLDKLGWRASSQCQITGMIILIAVTLPWVILACFASVIPCRREVTSKGAIKSTSVKTYTKLFSCLLTFLIWILCWAPIAFIAVTVTARGDSQAWVKSDALSDDLFGNIIDQQSGRIFSERVATMGGNVEPIELSSFTWNKFSDVINKWAPTLGFRVLGIFGYYSLSEFCLPMFLSRPFLNYESVFSVFSFAFMIIICTLIMYVTALVIHTWMASKRKVSDDGQFSMSLISFTLFWASESLTWIPILGIYFAKIAWPAIIDNVVFQATSLGLLAVNCGVVSVYVHVRKRRVHFRLCAAEEVETRNPLADKLATPRLTVESEISEATSLRKTDSPQDVDF